MKLKNFIVVVFLIFITSPKLWSCSCETLYFCDFVKDDSVKVAFKAIVIEKKDYGGDNLAIYLQIIHSYKSEIQTTDTIKIYGKEYGSSCALEVQNFSLGDTIIMALGELNYFPIINPDSLFEDFSEFSPNFCDMVYLRIKSGIVSGWITEEVFKYPVELFDENLLDCDFPVKEEAEYLCPASDELKIFPNPSVNGYITLQSSHGYDSLKQVRVFAIDGRLMANFQNLVGNPDAAIEIELLGNGVHILELICEDRRYYKKVIVTR